MKKITEIEKPTNAAEKVIQFGEGNFMRGFFDWQLQQMNTQGKFNGSAVVVQPIQQGLAKMLAEQNNLYTVILEGLVEGQPVQTSEVITTISRVLNPYEQWQDYLALAEIDALDIIVSNTTEAGIVFDPQDKPTDAPPKSFPAKLTALLYQRYRSKKSGYTIIPCELIDRNGEKLKACVQQYSTLWQLEDSFTTWLENENVFCCSLVDRIVPGYPKAKAAEFNQLHGYEDRLMVTAEPFMLWVIEDPSQTVAQKLPLPDAGMNVIFTDDLTPYRERKVHLLNGPHTAMVPLARLAGLETVEEVMLDSDFGPFIDQLFSEELIPMLDLPQEELNQYAEQIKERFKNPYVHHQLQSIALNSVSKFNARLLPILLRHQQQQMVPSRILASLAGLIKLYLTTDCQDDAAVLTCFAEARLLPASEQVSFILAQELLWGMDLSGYQQEVTEMVTTLSEQGPRQLIRSLKNQQSQKKAE
jgi:tagaturonate reductase